MVQVKGKIVSVAAMAGAAAVMAAGTATAVQPIQWQSCETLFNLEPGSVPESQRLECAIVDAPLDYDDPDGPTTPIAVSKVSPKSGESKSAIFGNPGGPGDDALMFWANRDTGVAPTDLYNDHDLVAVQPRGLWGSNPIQCDPSLASPFALNPLHDACYGTNGAYIESMTTENAARDMDFVRQSMGLETIDFYGVSYGTKLGADYATLYPEHTGKMMLDSNVGPDWAWSEQSARTTEAQHARMYDMFEWIADNDETYGLGDTPLKVFNRWKAISDQEVGGPSNMIPPAAEEGDLPTELRGTPVQQPALDVINTTAPGRARLEGLWNAVTLRELTNNAASGMYDTAVGASFNETSWPMVANILSYYDQNQGAIPRVSPVAAHRIRTAKASDNTQFNTQHDMFRIVTCNEDQTQPNPLAIGSAELDAKTGGDRLLAEAAGQRAGSECLGYEPVTEPIQVTGEGLEQKPVILQNVHDAVTPMGGAENMLERMGGTLVTVDNGGHGAFRTGNKFIDDAVTDFFGNGTVPPETLPGRPTPKPLPTTLEGEYPSNTVGYGEGENPFAKAQRDVSKAVDAGVKAAQNAVAPAAGEAQPAAQAGEKAATEQASTDKATGEQAQPTDAQSGAQQPSGQPGGAQGTQQDGAQATGQQAQDTTANDGGAPANPAEKAARDAAAGIDQAVGALTGTQQNGAQYTVDQYYGK